MRNSLRMGAAALAATVATAGAVTPAFAAESHGPKNIIYMIGDGMGYGHVAYNNLYETGQSMMVLSVQKAPKNSTAILCSPSRISTVCP